MYKDREKMEPRWHIAFCNVTITKYTGMTYADYYGSPANMLEAQLKASEIVEKRFGVGQFIRPYVDSPSGVLSSFLGMDIVSTSADELPYVDNSKPLVTSLKDAGRLSLGDPGKKGLMAGRWKAWNYYKSRGYRVRVGGYDGNIIGTACEISSGNFLLWMVEDPDGARKMLDFIVDAEKYLEDFDNSLCGENPDGYTGDDFSGLLSPGMYREFAVPCYRRMYEGKKSRFMHSELLRAEHLRIARDLLQITSYHGAGAKNLTLAEMREIMGNDFWVQLTPQEMREFSPGEIDEKIRKFSSCGAAYVQIYPGRDTTDKNMEAAIAALKRECKGGPYA